MKIIERKTYLSRIISHLNHGVMIVLVGQRRVGKSYMLKSLNNWLKDNRPDAGILFIDKELPEFGSICDATGLYEYVTSRIEAGKENYLLIDEIQNISGYENALRGLYAEELCQIIITGSNAYIFSTELSTRLSGRYIEIPIYPLTYNEFLTFRQLESSDSALTDYLRIGGLPGLTLYDSESLSEISDYLQGVYNTIIVRDILEREDIRNTTFLRNLSAFIADNIGKLFSVNNIVNYLNSSGDKVTYDAVRRYLDYLRNALIIETVPRYDIHGKKLFDLIGKNYFSDHGLCNLLTGFNLRGSIEKVMENVVYNTLLSEGYEVYVGILRSAEIDFVARRKDSLIYVQVTYLLGSKETITREFEPLTSIKDNYPKYVVSMDPISGELPQYPGIHHLRLIEFLTMFNRQNLNAELPFPNS